MYVYMQTSLWLTDIRNMNMATNAPNHNINTLVSREKKKGRKKKSCSERKGVNTSPCFFQTLKYVRRLMCYSFKGIDNDINSNEIKMKTNGRERRRKSGQTFCDHELLTYSSSTSDRLRCCLIIKFFWPLKVFNLKE